MSGKFPVQILSSSKLTPTQRERKKDGTKVEGGGKEREEEEEEEKEEKEEKGGMEGNAQTPILFASMMEK
ncbi:hypothetical protein T02_11755 [Trichinella nativa]|uniref:Uncharacterized protein n=1 Tax=Trichinella nativa TaxID=6335 RepID=A0A0V1L5Q2_9BILA|nr:hypothetical protein T02_11755 [Trichinella nativa]